MSTSSMNTKPATTITNDVVVVSTAPHAGGEAEEPKKKKKEKKQDLCTRYRKHVGSAPAAYMLWSKENRARIRAQLTVEFPDLSKKELFAKCSTRNSEEWAACDKTPFETKSAKIKAAKLALLANIPDAPRRNAYHVWLDARFNEKHAADSTVTRKTVAADMKDEWKAIKSDPAKLQVWEDLKTKGDDVFAAKMVVFKSYLVGIGFPLEPPAPKEKKAKTKTKTKKKRKKDETTTTTDDTPEDGEITHTKKKKVAKKTKGKAKTKKVKKIKEIDFKTFYKAWIVGRDSSLGNQSAELARVDWDCLSNEERHTFVSTRGV